jgi:hypothetical protein
MEKKLKVMLLSLGQWHASHLTVWRIRLLTGATARFTIVGWDD